MNNSNKITNFYRLVDNLFLKIEDKLNSYDNQLDIDYEIEDYVLTITFLNNKVIIINKQESLKQIWMATTKNGYHFNYKKNIWVCHRSNKDFWEIFEYECSIQLCNHLIFDQNKIIK